MATTDHTPEVILEELQKAGHQKVKVAIADIDGVLRGKYIHINKLLSAVQKGFGFCNVVFGWDSSDECYDNIQYTGWHTGYPDARVRLDLSTYRHIPWEDDIPFFLGEFVHDDGNPLEVCPRQLLRTVIARAEKMGFKPTFGLEFEWFNFQESPHSLQEKQFNDLEPLTPGMFGYSVIRSSLNSDYFNALMDGLAAFEVPLEGLHTETGPGVFEAAILYSDALEAADRAILFKNSVKEIGYRHGILPTFMAKWDAKLPGCSGHMHQSLWDENGKTNLFYDKNGKISKTFEHYLAGQMHCLPEFLPFFAPTVNSYKRLVEGLWAPTRVTWGYDNRTTAFRVIPDGEKGTRLETRITGGDINPYIAVAAALASGLYGIENKLELPSAAITGNAYEAKDAIVLSKNLMAATQKMMNSTIARTTLGDSFIDHFGQSRIWEWRQFEKAVTTWELRRYFEII